MSISWIDQLHFKTWKNYKEVLRLYLYVKNIFKLDKKKTHKNEITEQSDKVIFIFNVNMLTAYVY